jgi:hypothetical protein
MRLPEQRSGHRKSEVKAIQQNRLWQWSLGELRGNLKPRDSLAKIAGAAILSSAYGL